MTLSDKQKRGCYYARYSDEYNEINPDYLTVFIRLKRRFPEDAVAQCEKPFCDDPRVIDAIDFSWGGDCRAYLSAAKEEDRKVKAFRNLCEAVYPILKKIDFGYGVDGQLIWMGFRPDPPEANWVKVYEHWRSIAWSMWQCMPHLAKTLGLVIKDYEVEPLPGPWKMRFL